MFITSCTTAVAFLANYFSVLLPISTFGVYAAIIVIANFFLAMTFFPAVIMLKYYMDNFGFVKTFLSTKRLDNCKTCDEESHSFFQKISDFYGGVWSLSIIKYRVPILFFFLSWLIFASYQTSSWKSLSKEEEYLPTDHFIMEGKNIILGEFAN